MLLLALDRTGRVPAYRQICDGIARLVDHGTLGQGERLPATRNLATTLGVNRSTVVRAYQELWALGYLESRPGSYSRVRGRARSLAGETQGRAGLIDWDAAAPANRWLVGELHRFSRIPADSGADGAVNFGSLAADRGLSPVEDFRRSVRAVLASDGAKLLDYGEPVGYRPLRETIAQRLRVHGVTVTADEILITNGSQHALDLVLRLLARPGGAIVCEAPTYAMAIPLFRLHQLDVREVGMREDGIDLDALERSLRRTRPALVYTMPNFQNPTGITTSQAHRERLLAACERHRVPLVEDGFEEELKYFGKCALPIKSMDTGGVVVYLGTFSKVVFPGLRVGWVAAERACIERLLAISRFSALSANVVAQAALQRFCASGCYESLLRRVHRAYRRRMLTLLAALHRHLPERGVRWTQPAGGYTLWLTVEATSWSEDRVDAQLRAHGVLASRGSLYFTAPHPGVHFRISIANLDEAEIEEGCRRLGAALAEVVGD